MLLLAESREFAEARETPRMTSKEEANAAMSRDESENRYQIEFSTDEPDLIMTVATLGAAPVVKGVLDKVLGEGHGWYCKITDSVTDLSESRWGATKGDAQEEAFRALKRKVDGFLENREREKEEEDERRRRAHQERQAASQLRENHSSSGDSSGTEFWGKVIGVLVFVGLVVWFVFAVAIPLLVIDIAAIALIAALIHKDLSKWLLPLSVLGAVLVVADYNQGWFTKSLAANVSFLAGLIPILLYVNVLAGLIAAYLVIRNFMDERNPHPEQVGELTKRNVISMGCLLLVGCLTFGLQAVVDSHRRQARQSTVVANLTGSGGNIATPVGAERVQPQPVITTSGFVGDWQYTNSQGNLSYLRIVKMNSGQFQLFEGWPGDQGAMNWRQDGYLLAPASGKLAATIQSGNFRATHGAVFEYRLMVERIDDDNLLYSVKSELTSANETEKASKIKSSTPPASNSSPKSSANESAIVFDPPSNVRIAPSAASDALCSINDRASIRILGSEGNWYKTDICGGKLGYIHRSQVRLSELEPASGAKPSFNCSNATTPTERLICRDGELASAELQMVAVRNQVAKQLSGNEAAAFRAEHLEWFKNWSRTCNAIGKSQPEAELRACIVQFLSNRTQQLRAQIR